MNSEICPYTYEDIQSCKDISMDKVLKDYHNLCEFKADTNPRKFCGNNTLYYYQFRNLLNCKREKGKSLKEVFDDPELVQQLWKDTIKRNRRDKDPICSATDVYECHRINKGAIVFFKSSTAKYIYKLFNSKSVLDFTAGWGGRMLGASSLGINYIGIDTNINLKIGYENMIKDLQLKNCKMIWVSCLYLKEGGHMCINISPAMFKSLMKLGYRQPNKEIDLRQQLGQQYKTKSQDLIYVWSK